MINQPIIAVVTALQGVATVKDSDGSVRILQVGDSIHLGETVQTGDGSFVTLQYDSQLTQTVGANSFFVLDSNVVHTVLAEEDKQISPDIAVALLSESVGPNPVPPIFIMPKDDGLHSLYAADYLAPESLVHSGYPTIGIGSQKQHPLELYHSLLSNPPPEIVPAPIIVAINHPPTITVDTGNPPTPGNPSGANDAVYEAGLPFGSTPPATTEFAAGTFRVSDPDGVSSIQSVTINGTTVPIGSLAGTLIHGADGDLTVTSYDGGTGVATYSYQLLIATTDVPIVNETDVFTLTTSDGTLTSAPAQIVIDIIDDVPTAVDDNSPILTEPNPHSVSATGGNVLSNDQPGADAPAAFVAWNNAANAATMTELSTYGTISLNPTTGAWTFTLDGDKPATQALTEGETKDFSLQYTMQDADGDQSSAHLSIHLVGTADSASVGVSEAALKVYEHGLVAPSDGTQTATSSFTISATDGIASILLNGNDTTSTSFTLAQMQAFNGTQTVNTGQGIVTFTSYVGDDLSGTVHYTYTLSHTIDNDSVVPVGTDVVDADAFGDRVQVTLNTIGGGSASGGLAFYIVDDVPTATTALVAGSVDEDGLASVSGMPDYNPALAVNTGNVSSLFAPGADLPPTYSITTLAASLPVLTSGGLAVTYSLSGNTLTASTTAHSVFTFTLDPNTGAYTFTLLAQIDHASGAGENSMNLDLSTVVQIRDSDGDFAIANPGGVIIKVVDDVPTAASDTGSVNEGALLSVAAAGGVLVNDKAGADGYAAGGGVVGARAAGGDTTTAVTTGVNTSIVGLHGTLVLQADGSYTYQAAANNISTTATDTFVYTIKDGDGDLATTTLTITLADVTLAPDNQTKVVNEAALDTTTTGSDLGHGTAVGSNPSSTAETTTGTLAVVGATGYTAQTLTGTHGLFQLNADGTYVYTLTSPVTESPPANNSTDTVTGVEVFTYTAHDIDGNTVQGTITINVVDDVPLAPIVTLGSATVGVDETPGVQVISGASDVLGSTSITFNNASTTVAALFSTVANKGADPDVAAGSLDNGALSFASTGSASIVSVGALNYGADGPAASGTPSYALVVSNTASGITLTDGTAITLSLDGSGRIIGTVGTDSINPSLTGKVAFALDIDPATGHAYVAQYLSLHQDSLSSTPNDFISLGTGTVSVQVTLTDGDGDQVSSTTTDISSHITFLDDGPTAPVVTLGSATVGVDETPGVQVISGASDVLGSTSITFNNASTTVAALFSTVANKGADPDVAAGSLDNGALSFASTGSASIASVGALNYGADGPAASGTPSYALVVSNTASGITLTDGAAITLSLDGSGRIIGTVGTDSINPSLTGKVAFALDIDPATGHAYVAQYLSLHQDSLSSTPNDFISLGTGTVSVQVTLTDGDGDQVSSTTTDISSHITFLDDGPTAPVVTLGSATVGVDETPGVQTVGGATDVLGSTNIIFDGASIMVADLFNSSSIPTPGTDPDVPTSSLDHGALSFASTGGSSIVSLGALNYGADGPAASGTPHYTFVVTNAVSGRTLTDGTTITLVASGDGSHVIGIVDTDTINPSFTGKVAFALAIDPRTGQTYVAQYLSLHQDSLSTTPNDSLSLAANTVGVQVTLTDGDGDQISSTTTDISSHITFLDDGPTAPVVTLGSATVGVDETPGVQVISGASDVLGSTSITFNNASTTVAALFSTVANKGADPDVAAGSLDNGALSFASTGSASIVSVGALNYGADGPAASGTPSYALVVSNTASGITLTDGAAITLSLDGSERIIGTVGTDSINPSLTGKVAFALDIDPATGHAYVAQYLSLHQDSLSSTPNDFISLGTGTVSVQVTLTDGDGDQVSSTTTDISSHITFLDDGPTATAHNNTGQATGAGTNLLITLDISGSMNDAVAGTGMTKLELAKASLLELLAQYNAQGAVAVDLVTFSTNATAVNGGAWMTLSQAKTVIQGLTAGGTTNYDDALNTTINAFNFDPAGNKVTTAGASTVAYFLSDGLPNASSLSATVAGAGHNPNNGFGSPSGIDGNPTLGGPITGEDKVYTDFLNTNNINAFALGVGVSGLPAQNALDPMAYNGTGTGTDTSAILVSDVSQLQATLVATVHSSVAGNLITDDGGNLGADGGHVQSIVADGITYNYDGTQSGAGGSTGVFSGHTWTITTASSGVITAHLDTGAYTYTGPSANSAVTENMGYTLVDGDGDTMTSTLDITISPANTPTVVRDVLVVSNQTNIAIPDWALLHYDTGPNSGTQTISAVSGAILPDSVTHALGGPVQYGDPGNNGGSFQYTDLAGSLSANANVTVEHDVSGTIQADSSIIDKLYLNQILIGGAAGDTITGGAGDDVLIGDGGNDTLQGGYGDDILVGGAGNDSLDGGAGVNTASYINAPSAVVASLALGTATGGDGTDTLTNIQNITGSSFNDTLTGDGNANVLMGGLGNDTLIGGGGSDTASYADAPSAVNVNLLTNTATGGDGSDTLSSIENVIGSDFNDTFTSNTSANTFTGGSGADTFVIASGNSSATIGGSGNTGTITGYDAITDFNVTSDVMDLAGTPTVALNTGGGVNGTDSTLTFSDTSQPIKSHSITNGIITFDDANTYSTPLTLSSTAQVAAVVQYLQQQTTFDIGNTGATVAFVANIAGVSHTYIYEQVGNTPSGASDLLVDLQGVALTNLNTLIPSHVTPVVLDISHDGLQFLAMGDPQNHVYFDYNNDGIAERTAWAGPQDAILVHDANGDGIANNGSEIVFADPAAGAMTDLQGLAMYYDSNHDGVLNAQDTAFNQFGIWQDKNSDGVTDPGEFHTLTEAGIANIQLTTDNQIRTEAHGQVTVYGEGLFTSTDGSQGAVGDVSFATLAAMQNAAQGGSDNSLAPVAPTVAAPAAADTGLAALVGSAGDDTLATHNASTPAAEAAAAADPFMITASNTNLTINNYSGLDGGHHVLNLQNLFSAPIIGDAGNYVHYNASTGVLAVNTAGTGASGDFTPVAMLGVAAHPAANTVTVVLDQAHTVVV